MAEKKVKKETRRKVTRASQTTSIRIPLESYARLVEAARLDRRTLSNFLVTSAEMRADEILGRPADKGKSRK